MICTGITAYLFPANNFLAGSCMLHSFKPHPFGYKLKQYNCRITAEAHRHHCGALRNDCTELLRRTTARKHCGSTAEALRSYCGATAELLRNDCGATAQLLRNDCGTTAEPLRKHCGTTAEALQNDCGATAGALRSYCGTTAEPLRSYCGTTAEILRARSGMSHSASILNR